MNESELRQELNDKQSDRFDLIKKLEKKISSKFITITFGKNKSVFPILWYKIY